MWMKFVVTDVLTALMHAVYSDWAAVNQKPDSSIKQKKREISCPVSGF